MKLYNVHHRDIDAPASVVGPLIDTLASADDRLWPHQRWPRMAFDLPGVTVGGRGGHGPVGYVVTAHEPGRSVTFTFTDRPRGLRGRHQYVVQATGPDTCTLWHVARVDVRGLTRWTWFPFWGPLHDALIEDSLHRAARAGATPPAARPRWSVYVRLLRRAVVVARSRPRPDDDLWERGRPLPAERPPATRAG